MSTRSWRRTGYVLAALFFFLLVPITALAKVSFNLPSEPLSQALKDLATQAHLNVYYDPSAVAGFNSRAIRADIAPSLALKRLLTGTGLIAVYVDEDTVRVESTPKASGRTKKTSAHSTGTTDNGKTGQPSDPATMIKHLGGAIPGSIEEHAGERSARDPSQENETLGTIVVTAQRYTQNSRDVPISMTVFSGRQLRQLHVDSLSDLSFVVPSLEVQSTQYQHFIMIRGVGNAFGSGATVGEYIDEADVTPDVYFKGLALPTIETYDLRRVEVLRGPQGTLFGEGSLGGTVRFITNPPSLHALDGYTDLRDSITQYGAPSERAVTVVNAPLEPHVIGVRIASDFEHDGGFLDQPAAGEKNYNSNNVADARIEMKWLPLKGLNVSLMEIIHRAAFGYNGDANRQYQLTQPFHLTTTPNGDESYNVSNVALTYDLPRLQILSATTYFSRHLAMRNLGGVEPVTGPSNVTPLWNYLFNPWLDSSKSFSEDFRLTNRGSSVWHWTVGAYYKHFSDQDSYKLWFGLPGPTGTSLPGNHFTSDQYGLSRSISAYGNVSYKVLDRLTVGTGVRYFRDRQNYINFNSSQSQAATFKSTDPRAYIVFRATKHINVYGSAAKGFRSGGFNAFGVPPYRPEQTWAYEVGTKMRLLNSRLSADIDGFVTNYSNIVELVFLPQYGTDIYTNAGRVQIKGAEASVSWIPANGWLLRVAGDYLNGRFVEVQGGSPPVAVGDPLELAPRYQIAFLVRRSFLTWNKVSFIQLDYKQRPPVNTRDLASGPWYYSQSGYLYMLGAEFGMRVTHNMSLDVFGSNLLDDRNYIDADVIEGNSPLIRPRTVGVDLRVKF